ncbi:unnamed protein product [Medioppia subpectinata]|uniref:Secreted protein n=1 Tax=Medioppia subpectinata TaxID=1979941 RepID=A0A7R9KGD7_9ACAR|nr:unnamed protein product [Medioppia subpectinata]CAG2102851.1 unnamed protein product [Medioppia subpectinata]
MFVLLLSMITSTLRADRTEPSERRNKPHQCPADPCLAVRYTAIPRRPPVIDTRFDGKRDRYCPSAEVYRHWSPRDIRFRRRKAFDTRLAPKAIKHVPIRVPALHKPKPIASRRIGRAQRIRHLRMKFNV